jgi:hypothetical protein
MVTGRKKNSNYLVLDEDYYQQFIIWIWFSEEIKGYHESITEKVYMRSIFDEDSYMRYLNILHGEELKSYEITVNKKFFQFLSYGIKGLIHDISYILSDCLKDSHYFDFEFFEYNIIM